MIPSYVKISKEKNSAKSNTKIFKNLNKKIKKEIECFSEDVTSSENNIDKIFEVVQLVVEFYVSQTSFLYIFKLNRKH